MTLAQITIPDFGTNEAMAILLVGFLMSPAISLINRIIPPGYWSSEAKAVLTFVCCLVAAGLLVASRGDLVFADLFRTFLIIFVMAIMLYRFYFQPSGIATAISGT